MPSSKSSSRRTFLRGTSLGAASYLAASPGWSREEAPGKPLRFGLIADVHKDIMHDADRRLQAFIDFMKGEAVDFIAQLGDFCVPKDANQGFLGLWNQFPGPRYHVLGNHDTDGGYQREQTVAWWKMPARYYSFDQAGTHFVVLDGNDRPADHKAGYPRFIAPDQLEWLRGDLAATQLPTIVFIHQSLERPDKGGVQNGPDVRRILEGANQAAGRRKVVACFSGHHHRDYVRRINDIVYPQINSASYHWVGGDYQRVRYSKEIDAAYPYIKYTVPYRDPLFALVTIDHARGAMSIEGRKSSFVGPPPWELGKDREAWEANTLTPHVSDWKLPI